MANVYEGAPDSRQSDDPAEPLSRFRPKYRALSDEEKLLHDGIKEAYAEVERLIGHVGSGRYHSLAITALEASCMWAIKALTDVPASRRNLDDLEEAHGAADMQKDVSDRFMREKLGPGNETTDETTGAGAPTRMTGASRREYPKETT